jgi:integrase
MLMSWDKQGRWQKMYKGKMYRVSLTDLGVPSTRQTKEGSYQEANAWWLDKKAELDVKPPHPLQTDLDDLARKLAYVKAHDLPDEVAEIDRQISITEERQPGPPEDATPDPPAVPADLSKLLDSLRGLGCNIPAGVEEQLMDLERAEEEDLTPSAQVWADRFRRDPQDAPERTVGHWADKWLAIKEEQCRTGARAASGLRVLAAVVREFKDFCGATLLLERIDAGLWERFGDHCEAQVAARDADPRKGWKAAHAQAIYLRSRTLMKWFWEQGALPALPRNINRQVRLTRPADPIRTYTKQELHAFFKAANGQHKLHILLALNCGMYEVDIANLLRTEIDLRHGEIKRRRSKTRKRVNTPVVTYRLWPSTKRMLQRYLEPDGDLALRTPQGNPWGRIRWEAGKWRQSHSVACYHAELRKKLCLWGSFKTFRKTSATTLGSDHRYDKLANHFLGEAPTGTADKHYVAMNSQRFAEAVTWLGDQFELLDADQQEGE